jgi:hypothetical protein
VYAVEASLFDGIAGSTDSEALFYLALTFGGRRVVRALYPDNARFQRMTAEDRVVVSEPVSDLPGVGARCPSPPR